LARINIIEELPLFVEGFAHKQIRDARGVRKRRTYTTSKRGQKKQRERNGREQGSETKQKGCLCDAEAKYQIPWKMPILDNAELESSILTTLQAGCLIDLAGVDRVA
jgi:hypothetical protein